jgi:glycosyltransferase involved in cell wall biosynthesis
MAALWVWRFGCDVVNLHGTENAFVLPLLLPKCPVVVTSHGTAYKVAKWGGMAKIAMRISERLAVKLATAVTAVSAPQADSLSKRYGRKVKYIPNGVDAVEPAGEADVPAFLESSGLEQKRFWLFAAARVDPIKGCHTLLEAYRRVEDAPPLLVVGDLRHAPGYEERVRRLARGLPIAFVPRTENKALLMGLLRAADLFVFPSTVEAMSMMLLEALAVGVPTIVSDIPENMSILPPGVVTFRTGDAADLTGKLRAFQRSDKEVVRAAAAQAAGWVRRSYEWDVIAARYEEVYEQAIAARRARRQARRDRWRGAGARTVR